MRELHLQAMINHRVHPSLSLICAGLLTDYSRIQAHTMNLPEASTETGGVVGG